MKVVFLSLILAAAIVACALPTASAAPALGTHGVVATLEGAPGSSSAGLVFAARSGLLYVANIFSDNVSVLDPRTRTVVDTVSLAGGTTCAHPLSVGYDLVHDVVYASCQQYTKITAIDGTTHRVLGDPIEVGSSPFGVVADPRNGDVYVVISHTNEVVVLDGKTRAVVERIPVGAGPFGIAYDTRRGYLYVANTQDNTISTIDGATNTVVGTTPVGAGPIGIVYDGRNDTIYSANLNSNTVTAVDAASGAHLAEIPVESLPFGLSFNPRDGALYVASLGNGNVDLIDTVMNAFVETVPVGTIAAWTAADPRTGHVWVTHDDAVSEVAPTAPS